MSETLEKEVKEVVLEAKPEVEEEKGFDIEGMMPEEVEMAKKHGLITDKEDNDTDEDDTKPKSEDSEAEEEEEVKPPAFEEVEKDETLRSKYNANEKALYFKWKSDKRKRQDAVTQIEDLKSQIELNTVKDKSYKNKLGQIKDLLGSEDLTVEQIQEIIGDSLVAKEPTKEDLEKEVKGDLKVEEREQQDATERLANAQEIGTAKYDNFDELSAKAQQVIEADTSGAYGKLMRDAFANKDLDPEGLVEHVVKIAALGKDLESPKEKVSAKTNKDVDRVIKNASKKINSASLASSNGRRTISHDDLTSEDAEGMSNKQWSALPKDVRDRLLNS